MYCTVARQAGRSFFDIRVGSGGDIETLCEIDLDASRLFERAGLELNLPPEHEFFQHERNGWCESLASGRALVAADANGRLLGFAASGVRDGEPYVEQLSVRIEYMRMGIGRALLAAAQALGAERGGTALWLTTYAHLSWNRPFYERAGFVVMPESTWGPEVRREAAYEARWLPSPEHRIVMRKRLGGGRPTDTRTACERVG